MPRRCWVTAGCSLRAVRNGSNALASTEIYDPETGAVNAGPVLSTPRAGLSATTLMDGKVLIAGGNNGTADLATAEIFNSATGIVSVAWQLVGSQLAVIISPSCFQITTMF